MGVLEALGMGRRRERAPLSDFDRYDPALEVTAAYAGGVPADPSTYPIATPWGQSDLQRLAFEDVFGSDVPENTRAAAMQIPAAARSRNLIVATLAGRPLRSLDRTSTQLDPQPLWLTRTDGPQAPQVRMAWTVDDLIWYGRSCWYRTNGSDGFPVHQQRLNQDEWAIDADNRVRVNGNVVADSEVTVFAGLHEGVLSFGRQALEDTRALYAIVRERLRNPVPQLELHPTSGETLPDTEIDKMRDDFAAARAGKNGGVAYTSPLIQLIERGQGSDSQLMIEARNAAALDIARLIGVHGGMLDATTPTASLNYETNTGRNQEFVDFDLALYMLPITARLSMDDQVPRGQHVAFDLADYTAPEQPATGPVLED